MHKKIPEILQVPYEIIRDIYSESKKGPGARTTAMDVISKKNPVLALRNAMARLQLFSN